MKIVSTAVEMFCKGIICFFSHKNGHFCVKIMIFVRPFSNILLFFQFLDIVPSFSPCFFSFLGQKAPFSLFCTFFTSRKRFSSFDRRIPHVGNVFKKKNLGIVHKWVNYGQCGLEPQCPLVTICNTSPTQHSRCWIVLPTLKRVKDE